MDVLLQVKTKLLLKKTQGTIINDVNELKNIFKDTDFRILELNSDLA